MNVRHVVVAWDASSQSARTLSDAAPFLESAEETTVVVVDPEPGNQGFGVDPGADIAPVLARHCSNVILDRIPSSGASIAQALLTRTIDASGDLIVMGCYGHSSLRESLLGGVTRDMIEQTTIPILLSH
jgi:nucleotide-binding universal stress UspA family protein